jgi:phosphatidylethanolamine-binding protein (PEBP) family uncharacterized protein
MRKPSHIISTGALVLTITLAGCASSSTPTTTVKKPVPPVQDLQVNGHAATIELNSPGLLTGDTIHVGKTCKATSLAPTFTWGELPLGTAELALFVLFVPKGNGILLKWAAAGISPTVREVGADELPVGAILGRQSGGHRPFSACPRPGTTATYLFLLYALPTKHAVHPGFEEAKLFTPIYSSSAPFGAFVVNYARS